MRFRALLVAVLVCGSLITVPMKANAFTFGSYCIKLSSSEVNWQVPKTGGSELYRFSFKNTCQKVISSFQIDISEDISGGSFSQWNALGEIFTLQGVNPGQQGIAEISVDYLRYVTAQNKNKIYLRSVESEATQSGGATNTTNNISVLQITFSLTATSSTSSSSTKSNDGVLAKGFYSETANDDGAPVSASDIVGNIRRINVIHKSNGILQVAIDYWKVPNSNFITRIKWCAPEDVDYLSASNTNWCNPLSKNDLNFLMTFSPSKASKGMQAGIRKNFKGVSKKGSNSNQLVYTISGTALQTNTVGLIEVQMYYSSDTLVERTTTCSGSYAITCSTRSSNIFERDGVNVKLEQN